MHVSQRIAETQRGEANGGERVQENEMYSKIAGGEIYQSPLANTDKKKGKIILISWVNVICWMWGEPSSLLCTLNGLIFCAE